MKCPSCGIANTRGSKICNHCGANLTKKYKTCNNGHNYDSSLRDCPYCPSPEKVKELKTSTSKKKTVIDSQKKIITEPEFPIPQTSTKFRDPKAFSSKKTVVEKPGRKKIADEEEIVTEKEIADEKKIADEEEIVTKRKIVVKDSSLIRLVGWLVSYDIDPAGIDFKLLKGKTKIGRNKNCDIVVNDSTISEEHVLLLCKDKKVILQDELSANGTFVNGERIEKKVLLNDGDEITLGSVTFIIKIV